MAAPLAESGFRSMRTLVLDLKDRRPVWAMPAWVPARTREALGGGWEVREIEADSDGSGDGAGAVHPEVLAAVADAEVYLGYGIPAGILEAGGGLRWVHSAAAGVFGSLTDEMRSRDVIFTNSAGVHAEPIADNVLGMMLHFARGFDFAVRAQHGRQWNKEPFYRADAPIRELSGSVVGIVGFGGIGRAVHARVAALGCQTLALRRRPIPEAIERGEVTWGKESLERLLSESDYVVLTAPGTRETDGLIDRAALSRMKASAVLLNVARGHLVDVSALVEALGRGRLRGAGLDVFRSEPLEPESPLWSHPGVLITPHVSAVTDRFWERETDLIVDNIERYLRGDSLRNVVDKEGGY